MTRDVVRAVANVARPLAGALDSLIPVERNLRVLADALEGDQDEDQPARTPRRETAAPRPTVVFSEIDSKKAERAAPGAGSTVFGVLANVSAHDTADADLIAYDGDDGAATHA